MSQNEDLFMDLGPNWKLFVLLRLLYEAASSVNHVDDIELTKIKEIFLTKAGLNEKQYELLCSKANEIGLQNLDSRKLARRIRHHISTSEKKLFLDCLWQVAHADLEIDPGEWVSIRILAENLGFTHDEILQSFKQKTA